MVAGVLRLFKDVNKQTNRRGLAKRFSEVEIRSLEKIIGEHEPWRLARLYRLVITSIVRRR